jgi:deoxyribonuclease V
MQKSMKINYDRPWAKTIEEAKTVQLELRSQVIREDRFDRVNYIAGVDVGFQDNYAITQAAVAILSFPDLKLVETAIAKMPTTFPYIPGFLSFREIPAILKALEKTKITPDMILCDGQGIAHPRRFGLACHLGVILDVVTIGVAKSLFVGTHDELPSTKGSWQPLIHQNETVGAVVRSRTNVNPLYVSIGHRISLTSAIDYTLKCTTKYRLPETTRLADKFSRE